MSEESNTPKRPRIIVTGSREWKDPNAARKAIADRLFDCDVESIIVHGAARGADRFAHQEAEKLGLLVEPHPADWSKGKSAGFQRNEEMARLGADLCIAFWNGKSNGTKHMLSMAEKYGIETEEVDLSGL